MVIWTIRTKGDGFDPIPEVVHGVQGNFLEKMSATPFHPSFLHQTTGAKGINGTKLSELVDDLVDEFLREVGHCGGRDTDWV